MEIKNMRIISVVLLLCISAFSFAQTEDWNDGWHTVKVLGDDYVEGGNTDGSSGTAAGTAQSLVQSEVDKVLEKEGSFYILNEGTDDQTIVQEFRWEASDDVYMYNFVILKKDDISGNYFMYDSINTENNYVDCILEAGTYRYKIGLFNFLGIIELETDWIPVEVKKAIRPEVRSVSPNYIYIETGVDTTLTVKGKDFTENASFTLINMDTGLTLPTVVMDKDLARNHFTVKVSGLGLEPGKYKISARNEGGLTFEYSPVTFVFSDAFDICVSLGRRVPIPLNFNNGYVELIENYWNWSDSTNNYNLGYLFSELIDDNEFFEKWSQIAGLTHLTGEFTFIPIKSGAGFFGFSIGGSAFMGVHDYTHRNPVSGYDDYCIEANFYEPHINFVYELTLGKSIIINAQLGGGVSILPFNVIYNTGSYDESLALGLNFDGGLAFQFYIGRTFYIELSYRYVFNLFSGFNFQYHDPGISMGLRF